MHPSLHAAQHPAKAAIIMGQSGEIISYGELEARSNRMAHFLRSKNVQIGDTIAICLENHLQFFNLVWGAQRAGLVYVAISSSRMTADEIVYILQDSGAKMLISSAYLDPVLAKVQQLMPGLPIWGFDSNVARDLEDELASQPETPIDDERAGIDMLYSSGTTGRPKGVRLPLPEEPSLTAPNPLVMLAQGAFGLTGESIYLSPSPLYHAAPLRWCMTMHKLGATVIVMEKYDPIEALRLIEKYKVTDSQWVPTHFVRMLKLPEAERARFDVSSLKCAIHAAAPCPVPVKEAMIAWWGPVLMEYYAGTEGNGFTFLNAEQWLAHKGSVGKSLLGIIHICDEAGKELPIGETGMVFFEGGPSFSYHNDRDKTKDATHDKGWTSLGDIGRLDEDGYLYLTDRKSFMIISGGVNIYPQEIENLLIVNDKVADAAVIGAPCSDLGEKVVAVVQMLDSDGDQASLAIELEAYLRTYLSGVKIPKKFDFRAELPRHPTGKLYKRLLRDEYW